METDLADATAVGPTPSRAALLAQADEALRVLEDVNSATELETHLEQFIRRLGFDYFSYILSDRLQLGDTPAGKAMILTSYPQPWRSRYDRHRYQHLDPVVTVGSRMRRPFFWGSAQYLRQLSASRRRLFDEARGFDIRTGFTIPIHGPNGECGLFSASSAGSIERCEEVARASRTVLHVLGAQVHATVVERLMRRPDMTPPTLTEQERVCLSWTMRGKTAWEISQIVNRSRPTIDFHLQKATRKLGAANKFHAAFKALQAGLI